MPDLLSHVLGFVVGFGLWEGLNVWLGDDPFALGPFLADVLGPAVLATALVVAYERWKRRRASA